MTTLIMYMPYAELALFTILYFFPIGGLLWLLHRSMKTRNVREQTRVFTMISLSAILFLIPTWESILGKYYLDKYCEEDGGMYFNTEERITSIYISGEAQERIMRSYLERGYDFVEADAEAEAALGYVRFSYGADGNLAVEEIDSLKSQVREGFDKTVTDVGPGFLDTWMRNEYLERIDTGEVVAGFRNYAFTTRFDRFIRADYVECTDIPRLKPTERFRYRYAYYDLVAIKKNKEL
jgi:hypothetical protein